jgi:hypothetical protein
MRPTDRIWIRRGVYWGLSGGVFNAIQALFFFPRPTSAALFALATWLLFGVVFGVGAAVFIRLGDDHS